MNTTDNTTTSLRISLKAAKVVRWMSEETICFTASVLFDGKVIGEVSNEGRGGCTYIRYKNHSDEAVVEAYAASVDAESIGWGFLKEHGKHLTAADICDHLIEQKDKADHLRKTIASIRKKAAKFVMCVTAECVKGQYRSFEKGIKAGAKVEAAVAAAKAKGYTLVAEMSDEAIAAHFIA